jgi:hypothetical protein
MEVIKIMVHPADPVVVPQDTQHPAADQELLVKEMPVDLETLIQITTPVVVVEPGRLVPMVVVVVVMAAPD